MAGLLDIFGGGGGGADDPYADILTPAQRNQMQVQGLLAMAGAFAQAGMPSRLPVPFGSALGSAAAALGTGQEAGMKTALENALAAQKVRDLRAKAGIMAKLNPLFQQALDEADKPVPAPLPAGPGVSPGPPGAGVRPGGAAPAAAPAAAGGPLMMDLPYPPGAGGGLLGSDVGAEGEYGTGQKNPSGLLGPAPPAQRAGAAVGPVETTVGGTAPAEPDTSAGWGPTFAQSRTGPARGETPEMTQLIERAAAERGVSPDVLRGLIKTESSFNPNVVSPSGAVGLAQLMPGTARELGVTNPRDPAQAIPAAASYLRQGLDAQGGDINRALMYYHGGPNTAMWGPKTQAYPGAVLAAAGGAQPAAVGGEDAGWGPTFAQGGPDQVIPSGPGAGGNLPITQAQYQPQGGGLAAPSTLPQLAAPGTLPPLAAPGGAPALGAGGKIPGLNMTPQKLAIIDAMAEAAGLGNPFKGLLDTYYKSPGYLEESAGATARGRVAVEEPSKLRTDAAKARLDLIQQMAKDGLTLDKDNNPVEIPGMRDMLGQTAGEVERAKQEAQSKFKLTDVRVIGPDGQPTTVKMPEYEQIYRQQQQARNATMGARPQPGDIIGTPALSKAEEALGTGSAEDVFKARTVAQDAAQSIETTKEARKLLDSGVFTGAGSDRITALAKIGNALNLTGANTKETVANTEAYFATVAGNVGRMIKQFGSGTGLSDADREYAAKMVAGQQTLDEASMRKILDINDRAGFNVINRHNTSVAGIRPGASLTPLAVTPPTPYQRVYPEGFIIQNSQGERRVMRNGNWEPASQ